MGVHTSDAGPQGMRRWSGELDGPLCRCGVMGRMIEVGYTREMGLACPHRCFFSLSVDFLDKLCRFSGGV